MRANPASDDYDAAEHEFLQAIRERRDWPDVHMKAVNLAEKSRAWNAAEHDAWRRATDDEARQALAQSTDTTELLEAVWRDVALAFEGKPAIGY
jgi:hypothetical protein